MLFNSFPFLLAFLPLTAVAYFAVPVHRLRLLVVIGASYYFYAYAEWWFPALMAASTAISYTTGRVLERRPSKRVLAAGVGGVLALLASFKYAGFTGGYTLDLRTSATTVTQQICLLKEVDPGSTVEGIIVFDAAPVAPQAPSGK